MAAESVPVEILGRIYHIRSKDNQTYIQNLAKMVHDRMVEVEKATQTVDSARIAVLTALNLADEYCKLKAEIERRLEAYEREKAKLLALVEDALNETPQDNSLPDA